MTVLRAFIVALMAAPTLWAPSAGAAEPERLIRHPCGDLTIIEAHYQLAGGPVVVLRPDLPGPKPVVYALAGLGEMVRGPKASAMGWREKYGLLEAMCTLHRGVLTSASFGGLVEGKQLAAYQKRLKAGYGGLVVVSPGAPRRLDGRFRKHLFDEVIPWVERTLPVRSGRANRCVDGISLGGRHALRLGFERPEQFVCIGTEQASVKGLWGPVRRGLETHPKARTLRVNLLSSHRDGFRRSIAGFAHRLRGAGVSVRHYETPGRHDKRFARGPGAIDMLLYHDGILNPGSGKAGPG